MNCLAATARSRSGSGLGRTLFLATSGCASDVNFFGIEVVRKYQLYAATRLARRRLTNVRVACGRAGTLA